LLSAALRLRWDHGQLGEQQFLRLFAERLPGFRHEEYAEASQRAGALGAAAWELANKYHDSKGTYVVSWEMLAAACPGFADTDYTEALNNNLTWARR
jgi:hypothetical protein